MWGAEGERVVGFGVEGRGMVGVVEVGGRVVRLESCMGMVRDFLFCFVLCFVLFLI